MKTQGVLVLGILAFAIVGCGKGSITGTVKNSAGQVISGAAIRTSPGTQDPVTGSDGTFTIREIDKERYAVTASKTGYSDTTMTVNLKDNADATVNIALGLSAVGGGVVLDEMASPNTGFDFSAGAVVAWSSSQADISYFYSSTDGNIIWTPRQTATGSGILSLGSYSSLDAVGSASSTGYGLKAPAVMGNVYAVKTTEGNYAKFRISNMVPGSSTSFGRITIEWAYQSGAGNTQFGPAFGAGATAESERLAQEESARSSHALGR